LKFLPCINEFCIGSFGYNNELMTLYKFSS
jgi:hypothetical protein